MIGRHGDRLGRALRGDGGVHIVEVLGAQLDAVGEQVEDADVAGEFVPCDEFVDDFEDTDDGAVDEGWVVGEAVVGAGGGASVDGGSGGGGGGGGRGGGRYGRGGCSVCCVCAFGAAVALHGGLWSRGGITNGVVERTFLFCSLPKFLATKIIDGELEGLSYCRNSWGLADDEVMAQQSLSMPIMHAVVALGLLFLPTQYRAAYFPIRPFWEFQANHCVGSDMDPCSWRPIYISLSLRF